jgi:hypothetical protein
MPVDQLIERLAGRARSQGLTLTGEGGLLGRLTTVVVEFALEGEMALEFYRWLRTGRRNLPTFRSVDGIH